MRAIKFIRRHFDFSPIVWLLLIATGISLGLVVRQASANHQGACPYRYNRCQFHGYYTDAAYNPGTGGQYFFSSGVASGDGGMPVYNVDQFVDYIRIRLNASTNYTDGYGTVRVPQDNVGAATIVNTMLGHNGTDFGNNRATGIQNAKNRFAEWESRVRYYDSVGAVTWNYNNVYFPDGEANSLYHPAANDNDFYNTPITDNQNAIMFWSLDVDEAAGTYGPAIYQIKKNCGNPIGVLRGLQTPPVIQGVVYILCAPICGLYWLAG